MSILTQGLNPAANETPERGSVASQGLRAGVLNAGAGLSALGGTALDAIGATDTARSLYDASAGLRARGQAAMPEINSIGQVSDLDSAGRYAVGLGAQAVPALGAGLAGAVLARNPLVGATIATTPFTAGDIAVRQQEDPAIAGLGAGRRLASAVGAGTVNAAAANAVPVAMGGRLLGQGIEQAGMGLGRSIATNAAEAIGGNAAAGALGEKITQDSLTGLNENRDTSGDRQALIDAAAGGAVMGVPFAAAGVAGQAMHGKGAAARADGVRVEPPAAKAGEPGAAPAPAPDAPKPSLMERVKGAFAKDEKTVEADTTRSIAEGKDVVDVEALKKAPPEQQDAMLKEADASRVGKVKEWAGKMYEDASLTPETRAAVDDFMADPADRTKQAAVAGFKMAKEAGEAAIQKAKEFGEHVTAKFDAANKGKTLSDVDSPKLHNAIADAIAPSLSERFPALVKNDTAMKTVTGSLRKVMALMQEKGKIDNDTAEQLHGWFGDDAPSIMASLHNAVLDKADVAATDKYYGAIKGMTDSMAGAQSLEGVVKGALSPEMQKSASPDQIKQMVQHLKDHIDGNDMAGKPKNQVEFETRQIEAGLREHFGDKTDSVLKAFNKDAEKRFAANKEDVRVGDEDKAGAMSEQDSADVAETTQYHGAGRNKDEPLLVRSPEAHRAEFSNTSQAERIIREQQQANPDRIVKFTKVKDLPDDVRAKYPEAGPDDGLVTVEGTKDETRITPDEFKSMRVDTSKTSHAQNNPSRIDTGVQGAVIDARAIVKQMKGKLDYVESDNISSRHRTARAFMEGIAAVQDHLGKSFEIPDSTVIAPGFTYGEAKTLSMRQPDPAWMKGKTDAEINTELARNESMKDMNDRELSKATIKTQDILTRREAAFAAKVQEERAAGRKLDKAGWRELRKSMGVDEAKSALVAAEREATARESAVRKEHVLDAEGRTEVGADEQIHRAAEAHNEKDLTRKTGLDDNPLRKDNFTERNPDGSLPRKVLGAIESKISRMENMKTGDGTKVNMIAKKVAEKARALFDNIDVMKKMDQALLASIATDNKVSSVAETVNALHDQYKDQLAPTEMKFGKDLRTRDAISKIAREIKIASSDLTARYEKLRAARDKAGKPMEGLLREFARNLNVPEAKLSGLNELYRAQRLEGPAKKPNAFVEHVLGEGDLAPTVKAIKSSDDPMAVRRAVDALADHLDNPRAQEVLAAANERLTKMLEKDPTAAYSMQRADPNVSHTSGVLSDVVTHIEKVLGKTVDVEFKKMLHAGEFVRDAKRAAQGMAEDVIRVSVHSMDPMGTAHHESLHAFFAKLRDQGLMDEASPLMKAADSERVTAKLRELLKNEPDALKQLGNLEERAAYMYQFWAAGKLELPAKPAGVLGHIADFFKKVLGIWTNDQRATHIMEYFNSGEFAKNMGDRSAVSRALMEGTNKSVEQFKTMLAPLSRLGNAVAATGAGRMRDSMIPALHELADAVYSPLQGASSDPGYIPSARIKRGQVLNDLAEKLHAYEPAQITDALESLQRGMPGATPEERLVMREVRKTLDHMYDYMSEAGVKVGDLGYGKDYFPRVWDSNAILKDEGAFRDMMQQYKDAGKFGGSIDQVIAALTRTDGSDLQVETVKPGMQHTKERILGFIRGDDAAPFLQKDMYQTLNSYVTQATRRAEWARRFGDDGAGLHELMDRAKREGATPEDLQTASDFLQGVDGTLGDHIDPKLRRAFGNMIVYQNIRLLPLALFSSLIDPGGVLIRGGTVGDAWKTMKRGLSEIPKGFKKDAAHDEWTKIAATMGVIDNAVLMHALGSSYSQGMTSNVGRKVNDVFFKYNLMEQFNTSMRVGATEAAVGFLGRHADGTDSVHSGRWLAELGLKPGEVVVKNGRALLTASEFKAHGMGDQAAQVMADRMTLAVNKWVDGAILRPNAAHKPIWMNDPHFALIAHLKQFVYSFQETILKRVVNEAKHGNVGPAYALAAYVPFMLAADLAKGVIVGGGNQPSSRENWDAGDYAFYEVQRAGLFGVGQFGVDMAKDVHRGGLGVGALAGPTVEQLGNAASVVAGPQQFKTFAMNALPANQLFDAAGEATASTNAVD